MAPEQIEGQDADAQTDIFAFGVVVYEMVTGRKAFAGKTSASLIGAILKDQPPAVAPVDEKLFRVVQSRTKENALIH
jgi:serine/threonine protein kinase